MLATQGPATTSLTGVRTPELQVGLVCVLVRFLSGRVGDNPRGGITWSPAGRPSDGHGITGSENRRRRDDSADVTGRRHTCTSRSSFAYFLSVPEASGSPSTRSPIPSSGSLDSTRYPLARRHGTSGTVDLRPPLSWHRKPFVPSLAKRFRIRFRGRSHVREDK